MYFETEAYKRQAIYSLNQVSILVCKRVIGLLCPFWLITSELLVPIHKR